MFLLQFFKTLLSSCENFNFKNNFNFKAIAANRSSERTIRDAVNLLWQRVQSAKAETTNLRRIAIAEPTHSACVLGGHALGASACLPVFV